MRGGLRNFGMDPKFAPLVVILIVILLGYFFFRLVGTIAATTVWGDGSARNVARSFAVLGFIIVRAVVDLHSIDHYAHRFLVGNGQLHKPLMRFLVDVTEPLLGPLRRMIPPLGWIDISPLVAILIVWLFQAGGRGHAVERPV